MSEPKPQGRATQICTLVFLVIGIVGFQVAAPRLFPPPEGGGFNTKRIVWAAVVGAAAALLGALVGKAIDSMRK